MIVAKWNDSENICCGKVSVYISSLVVGILCTITAFYLGLASGLIAAGVTGDATKLPVYVRIYRGVLCIILMILVILSLLLIKGLISNNPKLIMPWISLLTMLIIVHFLSVITALSLGKNLLNSTVTEEIIGITIFTSTSLVMLYVVFWEYKRQKRKSLSTDAENNEQKVRKEYFAKRLDSSRLVYNSTYLKSVNEAFKQKAIERANSMGSNYSIHSSSTNNSSYSNCSLSSHVVKTNVWGTPKMKKVKSINS